MPKILVKLFIFYTALSLFSLFVTACLSGCNTVKQTERKVRWLTERAPQTLAVIARERFPCEAGDTIFIDSIVLKERVIKKACPPTDTLRLDSAWIEIVVRDTTVYRDRIIKILDSAFYHIAKAELDSAKKTAELAGQSAAQIIVKEQAKAKGWRIATAVAGVAALAAIAAYFLKGKLSILSLLNNVIKLFTKNKKQ